MKKRKGLIIGLLLFCLCFSFAFADDVSSDIIDTISNDINSSEVIILNSADVVSLFKDVQYVTDENLSDDGLILVSAEQTRTTVTPSQSNGFKAVVLAIIGNYDTVVTDYTYQSGSSSYYSHSISIERDWAWIFSCCVFIVILYCTFRCIGGILCHR